MFSRKNSTEVLIGKRIEELVEEATACLVAAVFIEKNKYDYRFAPDADYVLSEQAEEQVRIAYETLMENTEPAEFSGDWNPEEAKRQTIEALKKELAPRNRKYRFNNKCRR